MFRTINWLALSFCLAEPACASTLTIQSSATVIAPADVSVQAAAKLLFSAAPGVLNLTIPGSAAPAAVVQLSASSPAAAGPLSIVAQAQSAPTMARLVALITEGAVTPGVTGTLSIDLASRGVLNGQGVQVAIVSGLPGINKREALSAIITFD